MSIKEMEKTKAFLQQLIVSQNWDYWNEFTMIQQFMQASLDQHKDHIEKFAELEKQIAELIKQNEVT
jgi:helix-turn-helix protein